MTDNQTIHPHHLHQSSTHHLNLCLNLFFLICGNLGNLLKVAFFLQKPLRLLPCTAYILCSTFSDFITLNNLPARQLLIHLFPNYRWIKATIDWSNDETDRLLNSYPVSTYDLLMCKMRSYFHMLSIDLSSQMLVFASINRFYFSYRRKKQIKAQQSFIRLFCHYPNVHRLCLGSFLLCALISIQHIFNFTIDVPSQGCVPRSTVLWTVWILVIHSCLSPLLMIIFGILTLKNLRQWSFLRPSTNRNRRERRRFSQMCSYCSKCRNTIQHQIENQLTSMIISETFVTVCSSLPYGIYALHHLLIGFSAAYPRHEWIELFIRMSMYFEASCGFYIYLLTLSALRKRFYRMFIEQISRIRSWFRWKF